MPGSSPLVIDRPSDVASALASPKLSVATPGTRIGAAAGLRARMARFSDGADHHRRRALIDAVLPSAHGVEAAAAARVDGVLGSRTATFDVMPAARTLGALLEPLGQGDEERAAAAIGVLFQARDATAALIGSALLALDSEPRRDARHVVERTLRGDAPVRCTRRVALTDVAFRDVAVPTGAEVRLVLADSGRDAGASPATFGSGSHGCPGSSLAIAVAVGVLRQVQAAGWRAVPGQPVAYEPRPNLRLPRRVLLERR